MTTQALRLSSGGYLFVLTSKSGGIYTRFMEAGVSGSAGNLLRGIGTGASRGFIKSGGTGGTTHCTAVLVRGASAGEIIITRGAEGGGDVHSLR